MKHLICIFLITAFVCSCLSGCVNEPSVNEKYTINDELVDVYLINDKIESELLDFFELAESSYEKFLKNQSTAQFIETIYDAFIEFSDELQANANITARIEDDREANKHLADYFFDYTIASEPILSLPLRYYENSSSIDETDVLSAVNDISQYFCGVDVFTIT